MRSPMGRVVVNCFAAFFLSNALLLDAASIKYQKRQSTQATYDFVIVGGGTAGLTLAARLTESSNQTVLVLEAGQAPTINQAYKAPGADLQVLGSPIDWAFTTLPQPSLNGRQLTYNRGRCLGGSSAINGLTYGRGSSSVYDLWQSLGNAGWSWNDVFPYFKKSTTFIPPTNNVSYQGFEPSAYSNGPVQVSYPGYTYEFPGSTAFVESLSAINVPATNELNAGNNVGAKQETLTEDASEQRSSSYDNYYMQAKDRPNLKVLTLAPVQRILLEEGSSSFVATGVVYNDLFSGATVNVTATKEVIMSAGAIQTPQLLMLSGIGPAATLQKNGIQMYVDNENVGMNMQDHTYFSVNVQTQASISYSSLYNDISKLQAAQMEYSSNKSGPLIAPIGLSFAFEKINQTQLDVLGASELTGNRLNQSHIEYYYESVFYPNYPTPQYTPQTNMSYISLTAGLIAPVSRGNVSIKSNQISDPPQINLNYYTAPTDQSLAIYAFRNLRKILAKYATYNYTIGPNNGEVSPGPSVQSDDEILEYIQNTAITVWHASGTCAMLPRDQGGVVDARLGVYGVRGLRVVDASIFPVIPDNHPQGVVYMVAEKVAAMIREDWQF